MLIMKIKSIENRETQKHEDKNSGIFNNTVNGTFSV